MLPPPPSSPACPFFSSSFTHVTPSDALHKKSRFLEYAGQSQPSFFLASDRLLSFASDTRQVSYIVDTSVLQDSCHVRAFLIFLLFLRQPYPLRGLASPRFIHSGSAQFWCHTSSYSEQDVKQLTRRADYRICACARFHKSAKSRLPVPREVVHTIGSGYPRCRPLPSSLGCFGAAGPTRVT